MNEVALALWGREAWGTLLSLGLIMARIGPAIWISPILGGRLVPGQIRTAVVVLLGAALLPPLAPAAEAVIAAGFPFVAAVVVKEAMIGASLGFTVAVTFWAAQAGGKLMDVARGSNMAEVLVPQSDGRSSPLGSLFFQLTVVLFFVLGGHRLFIAAVGVSYQSLPLAFFPAEEGLRGFALLSIRVTADLFLVAVALAAPVMAATLLADATLGVINRFVPQLHVFFLAMPAKAVLGILILILALGTVTAVLPSALERAVQHVQAAVELLGRGSSEP